MSSTHPSTMNRTTPLIIFFPFAAAAIVHGGGRSEVSLVVLWLLVGFAAVGTYLLYRLVVAVERLDDEPVSSN